MNLVHELFENQALTVPDVTAVTFNSEKLSYSELNKRANQLAHILRSKGVGPETLVAICVERSPEMVIALLAVLKAGGAYVPLDSSYPSKRLEYILDDTTPKVLITSSKCKEKLSKSNCETFILDECAGQLEASPSYNLSRNEVGLLPNHLAYVIYTSGSTGQPKGVMVEHASLLNYLLWAQEVYAPQSAEAVPVNSPFAFDATVTSLYLPLISGCTIYLLQSGEELEELEQLMLSPINWSFVKITPAHLDLLGRQLLKQNASCHVNAFVIGGEALSPSTVELWQTLSKNTRLINEYGPTETVVGCCIYEVPKRWKASTSVPIGTPISGVNMHILDSNLNQVNQGDSGEIYIGGKGVARGYLNRPELTDERFIEDPFSDLPGALLYRTGDFGRIDDDGNFDFLGRQDSQIKVNGFRIELGEIEMNLLRHADVKQVVAIVREECGGGKSVCAFVTPREDLKNISDIDTGALRQYLVEVLPNHLIPRSIAVVEEFPLTHNGKLDKTALLNFTPEVNYVAPEGSIEKQLAEIWQNTLQRPQISRDDSFFELGGNSMSGLKMLYQVKELFGVELRVRSIYQNPTLSQLAASIHSNESDKKYVSLKQESRLGETVQAISGQPCNPPMTILLTGATGFVGRFLLRRLLDDHEQSKIYCTVRASSNSHAKLRIKDTMSEWKLWKAGDEERIVAIASDISKPRLGLDNESYSRLANTVDSIFHCASRVNHFDNYAALKAANVDSVNELLHIATLKRPKLFNFISTLSIFNSQGQPEGRLVDESYRLTDENHLAENGYETSKWVAEQTVWLAQERGIRCNIFRLGLVWADSEQGRFDPLQREYRVLESCLLTGCGINDYSYGVTPIPVDYVAEAISILAEQNPQGMQVFHIGGSKGTTFNISACSEGVAQQPLKPLSWFNWIKTVEALHNQGQTLPVVPFIEFGFDMKQHDFESFLVDNPPDNTTFDWGKTQEELRISGLEPPVFDDNMIQLAMQYIQAHHPKLREQLCELEKPKNRYLNVQELIVQAKNQWPDREVVRDSKGVLTYKELYQLATNIAAISRKHGLQTGDRVGLSVEQSAKGVAIFLGIMAAGLSVVVLPKKPIEQLSKDIEELELSFLVTELSSPLSTLGLTVVEPQEIFSSREDIQDLFDVPEASYLTLTSGSTGKPKIVELSHNNVGHYAQAIVDKLSLESHDAPRFAHITTLSADLGHTAIFPTILVGGCVCVATDDIVRDPVSFWRWVKQYSVSHVKTTPSHFQALIEAATENEDGIDTVILGGEKLSISLANEVLGHGYARRLLNHYGPSEATIGVCCQLVTSQSELEQWDNTVPIGTAFGENRLVLEDVEYQEDGCEVGELYIYGPSVSLGYFNKPDLTVNNFVIKDNRPIGYRTGDVCIKTPNGQLQFLGRKDRQIKVRGYIVNPPDVEAVIEEVEGVSKAAILVNNDGFVTINCAVAFESSVKCRQSAAKALRNTLLQRLPDWMVPSRIYPLHEVPLMDTGKLDYRSIELLVEKLVEDDKQLAHNIGAKEAKEHSEVVANVVEVWAQLLGMPSLSPDTDIFNAGADSIMVMQSITRLRNKGWRTSLLEIQENPTALSLAKVIESRPKGAQEAGNMVPSAQRRVVSPMQNWFFDLALDDENHFNQAVLLKTKNHAVDLVALSKAIDLICQRHPLLSQSFEKGRVDSIHPNVALSCVSISYLNDNLENIQQVITSVSRELSQSMDIAKGKLLKVHIFKSENGVQDRILILIHHLAVDGVSWRILLDELGNAYSACVEGKVWNSEPPACFWSWSARVAKVSQSKKKELIASPVTQPLLFEQLDIATSQLESLILSFNQRETQFLLDASENAGCLESFLLQSFLDGVGAACSRAEVTIDFEGHGREGVENIERYYETVGWFTAVKQGTFSVGCHSTFGERADNLQRRLKEGSFLDPLESGVDTAELCFNFLGSFNTSRIYKDWEVAEEMLSPTRSTASEQVYAGRFTARVVDNKLTIDFVHDIARIPCAQADKIMSTLRRRLEAVSSFKLAYRKSKFGNLERVYGSTSGMILLSKQGVISREHVNELPSALITGATGYLGLQLINEMLQQEAYQPICLVRGESDVAARKRFLDLYEQSFGKAAAKIADEKVLVVSGDICSPDLGLPSSLNLSVSTVFHAAADTRLLGNKNQLTQTNEEGTRNVVAWAAQQGGLPLHYISTLAVAGVVSERKEFTEVDFSVGQRFLSPYEESKFNCERIVSDTAATRSATYIYRMGHIASDSISGSFQSNIGDNRIYQMIKSYVLAGCVVDNDSHAIAFSYVDVIAKAIVAIAREPSIPSQVFHVETPHTVDSSQLASWLTKFGYEAKLGSVSEYMNRLNSLVAKQDEAIAAVALQWSERPIRNIIYDSSRTLEIMDELGVYFPKPCYQWFSKMMQYAIEVGYLSEVKKGSLDVI
ncbi:D-alanine--D-alanyl carrier protein ligase [Pseudoalteromonas holothuriae]|uniref:D-alanine--D-alanyl carrier protein ligase n=1 Tax=Pseudoalteromonas holothuriae TaxID=2963714 RepID=A0ABN8ULC2_9GAMM|nr:non-ribosomal peptide synthetase [Pseudoalteromonas sp. CIP111951]CAH9059406.1 D-alanine--D-alanyl carrier protein ligase [Pseudoalteromonas sp. CIP111951]